MLPTTTRNFAEYVLIDVLVFNLTSWVIYGRSINVRGVMVHIIISINCALMIGARLNLTGRDSYCEAKNNNNHEYY